MPSHRLTLGLVLIPILCAVIMMILNIDWLIRYVSVIFTTILFNGLVVIYYKKEKKLIENGTIHIFVEDKHRKNIKWHRMLVIAITIFLFVEILSDFVFFWGGGNAALYFAVDIPILISILMYEQAQSAIRIGDKTIEFEYLFRIKLSKIKSCRMDEFDLFLELKSGKEFHLDIRRIEDYEELKNILEQKLTTRVQII
jgi:hypothetical protein